MPDTSEDEQKLQEARGFMGCLGIVASIAAVMVVVGWVLSKLPWGNMTAEPYKNVAPSSSTSQSSTSRNPPVPPQTNSQTGSFNSPAPAKPVIKVALNGPKFNSKTLRVGEKLTVALEVENLSDQTLKGLVLDSSGWRDVTIAHVTGGRLTTNGNLAWFGDGDVEIQAGGRWGFMIVAYPTKPGYYEFDFTAISAGASLTTADSKRVEAIGTVTVVP